MVTLGKRYIKYHLAITRAMHEANKAHGVYPELDPDYDPALVVEDTSPPTMDDLRLILEKVGGPYGWDRRREMHEPASLEHIETKLNESSARSYAFVCGTKPVGGAIIANVQKSVADIFRVSADPALRHDIPEGIHLLSPLDAERTVEVYKIGLFPEFTRRGWGKHFFPQMLDKIFENPDVDVVYLNTRNTNHGGVIKFYRDMSMNVIHAQEYPDDLIDPSRKMPEVSIPREGFGGLGKMIFKPL